MTSETDDTRREKFRHHVGYFDAALRAPAPYVAFTGEPGFKLAHHCMPYDAMGFLNPAAIAPRVEGEVRIFVVGDSTMNVGIQWLDTVPGRIEDIFHHAGARQVRAYNFGVTSSCTEQMAALIFMRLLDLDPDALVVVSGATDAFQPMTFDPRPGHPYNAFASECLYTGFFDPRDDAAWQGGLDYEAVLERAFALQTRLRADAGFGTPEWEMALAAAYGRSIQRLARIARAVAIPLLYVLEPIVVRKHPLLKSERSFAAPETLATLARQYDRFAGALADLEAAGLPGTMRILDASRALDGGDRGVFYDIVHYDFDGRGTVSRAIADGLRPMIVDRFEI